tara:strand:+ start:272 stop:790 length:519 start_codon:yes stop_codon:yes gene_type:complete
MAVLCEFICVVVTRFSIDHFYPGGWRDFSLEIPNKSFCTDGELVSISFQSKNEAHHFIRSLENFGLQHEEASRTINGVAQLRTHGDFVLIDQHKGPLSACDWVEFNQLPYGPARNNVSMCWLSHKATEDLRSLLEIDRRLLYAPDGWNFKKIKPLIYLDSDDLNSSISSKKI